MAAGSRSAGKGRCAAVLTERLRMGQGAPSAAGDTVSPASRRLGFPHAPPAGLARYRLKISMQRMNGGYRALISRGGSSRRASPAAAPAAAASVGQRPSAGSDRTGESE